MKGSSSNVQLYVEDRSDDEEGSNALTPRAIVAELDRYIVAQDQAKRAVAIALRNRWRRMRVDGPLREEITPKNILMIGPTGVGKTEIARRLARLAKAPFVKVEATKFTEVGYVGRDVDAIIRDLVEVALHMVREEEREKVRAKAEAAAEEEMLDLLLPGSRPSGAVDPSSVDTAESPVDSRGVSLVGTREKLREFLKQGKLDERIVEIELEKQVHTHLQVMGPQGGGEIEGQIKDLFSSMVPKQKEVRKVPVREGLALLIEKYQEQLVDQAVVTEVALRRAEESGIVFIDEVDKICGREGAKGPDVSREGVQRDLLPLVEGCTVSTKYGPLRTDHVLFIASGAFHVAKPSDLMPEFQGRFPIRVELQSLNPEHFVRILTEPEHALTKQYAALLETEGVAVSFTPEAIQEIARLTADVNARTENIGARRLHTLLEKLLEDLSFDADTKRGDAVVIDAAYVRQRLLGLVEDLDVARFIL